MYRPARPRENAPRTKGSDRAATALPRAAVGLCIASIALAAGCKPSTPTPSATPPIPPLASGGEGDDASAPERTNESITPAAKPDQPNIILVIVCTFRYDHLTPSGYPRNTTPFLDALAKRGLYFENAVGASSWTQPSVTSILTSLTPNVHRMYNRARGDRRGQDRAILPDEVVTLADCLHDAGYDTFCRINNIQAGDAYNIPQGFDDAVTASIFDFDTRDMVNDLSAWLQTRESSAPFFALLLTADAHYPYVPRYPYYRSFNRESGPVAEANYKKYTDDVIAQVKRHRDSGVPADLLRKFVDLYDAELAQLDDQLAALAHVLHDAGRTDDTVLVVTGDHGERFFERGGWFHGGSPDEQVVHVPWIMAGPGIPQGRRLEDVVRTIDIYPTLAAIAGGHAPPIIQGANLLPWIQGRSESVPVMSALASYTANNTTVNMVRQGHYKLFSDARLFDLANDPMERRNLITEMPAVANRLQAELTRWLELEETLRPRVPIRKVTRKLSPEAVERLRTLGYIND